MEKRIVAIEESLKAIREIIVEGFMRCSTDFEKIDGQLAYLKTGLDKANGELTNLNNGLVQANGKLDSIELRLGKIETRVDGVALEVENLNGVIRKINEVTGYEERIRNLK